MESAPVIASSDILPIVEIGSVAAAAINRWTALVDSGMNFISVVNPQSNKVSLSAKLPGMIAKSASAPNVVLGLILTTRTTQAEVVDFLAKYPNRELAIIHRGQRSDATTIASLLSASGNVAYQIFVTETVNQAYHSLFSGGIKVALEDGFNRGGVTANANYGVEDFYSNLRWAHPASGYDGFGDFLMVEDAEASGGPARAVAVHLTMQPDASTDEIWVKHFISDDRVGTGNSTGKAHQALRHLLHEVDTNPAIHPSSAIGILRAIYAAGESVHLGRIKAITHSHHIELISTLL